MRCLKARKLIPKYVDSELDGASARELRAHIESCASCHADEAQLRAALGMLDKWSAPEPVLSFDALVSRLDQTSGYRPVPRTSPARALSSWAVAALAALSIAGGTLLGISVPKSAPAEVPSEQQVAAAIDLQSFDDGVQASLIYGMEDGGADVGAEGGAR